MATTQAATREVVKESLRLTFTFFSFPIGQDIQGVMFGYTVKNCGQDYTMKDLIHDKLIININAKDYTQNAIKLCMHTKLQTEIHVGTMQFVELNITYVLSVGYLFFWGGGGIYRVPYFWRAE